MSFVSDFKAFALKGNVIDLAVGVVIGAAFGKIVTAVVDDVIMPLIGTVTGGVKFTDKFAVLEPGKDGGTSYKTLEEAKTAGANVLAYGHLIQSIVDFLIVALFIFIAVKQIAKLYKEKAPAPAPVPEISSTDKLLMEIRDSLKK
ncbi:MAG: large conductance mechanosensitive channel protein MscL [Chitinophagaceae bacterium]